MSASTLSQSEPVYLRPTRSIAGFSLDVVVEEQHTDDLEITEHPVEQGAAVTDHAYLKPATLMLKAGVTDAGKPHVEGDRPSVAMYEMLRKLQGLRQPFEVVTGKRVYKNMLIKSLGVVTDKDTENVLSLNIELQQVIIVQVSVVGIPRARQKKRSTSAAKDKGQEQVQKRASGLHQLGGSLSQAFGRSS